MQQTNTLHLDHMDRVALQYSPTVIGAIREIYDDAPEWRHVYILPPRNLQPDGLVRAIEEHGITICRLVPMLLRRFAGGLRPDNGSAACGSWGSGSQRVDWSDFDVFRRRCLPGSFP